MMSLPSVLARADELSQRLSVQPDRKLHPSFPPLTDRFYLSALSVPKQIAAVAELAGWRQRPPPPGTDEVPRCGSRREAHRAGGGLEWKGGARVWNLGRSA